MWTGKIEFAGSVYESKHLTEPKFVFIIHIVGSFSDKAETFVKELSSEDLFNKDNNKITELRTILQRESQNS